jgi:NAD(P)-dependent dehydrogenase (short-subunit alcohol dehydrogenase family)
MNSPQKVVIVTGGSKGIGEGCARAFCAAGWRVVIADIDQATGETTAAALSAAGPGVCHFELCDVRVPAAFQQIIDQTAERYGRIDCLINNAGWAPPPSSIDEYSVDDFKNLLDLNLIAVFAGCKFALPYLRKTKGSIVNISSLVAQMGQEHSSIYCATKGGVSALTKALAVDEAPHGVRVNAVLPGNIVTPLRVTGMARYANPQAVDDWIDSWQPPGRSGTITEVGQACLFLASEGASFITGIELIVSGGAELGYGIKAPAKVGLNLNF